MTEQEPSAYHSPRAFMQARRPERFSDSIRETKVEWSRDRLAFHLDNLGQRSLESAFEEFVRQLLRRVMAPNLGAQTGPMGGGDGKVDADTYPVADDLAMNWACSAEQMQGASEQWAVAVSTKKKWKDKLKSDISKIAQTGRGYQKAFFVTNQPVPAKDKHAVQDVLREQHQIQVFVFDREWILDVVASHNYETLFTDYLGYDAGGTTTSFRLGPNDTARTEALQECQALLEQNVQNQHYRPETAYLALKIAMIFRELERPKAEVEGAFARALRYAQRSGNKGTVADVYYHQAWTACWWHEDWALFWESYQGYRENLPADPSYQMVERLFNLWTILISQQRHGLIQITASQAEEQTLVTKEKLERLADQKDLPNASRSARATLAIMSIILDVKNVAGALKELNNCIVDASGHIGFNVSTLADLVTELEHVIGGNEEYERLFKNITELAAKRESSETAGMRYINRALGLYEREAYYDSIKAVGEAIRYLKQSEEPDLLSYAYASLASVYERIGLRWAARSTYLIAFSVNLPANYRDTDLTTMHTGIAERLKWIEIRLGWPEAALDCHATELCLRAADQDAEGFLNNMPPFDAAVAFSLLGAEQSKWVHFEYLPDNLEGVGLFLSAAIAKAQLGHDPGLPEQLGTLDELITRILAMNSGEEIPRVPQWFASTGGTIATRISGCAITISYNGGHVGRSIAKTTAAMLETIMATALHLHIHPIVPKMYITLDIIEAGHQPTLQYEVTDVDVNPTLNCEMEVCTASLQQFLATCITDLNIGIHTLVMYGYRAPNFSETLKTAAVEYLGLERICGLEHSRLGEEMFSGSTPDTAHFCKDRQGTKRYPYNADRTWFSSNKPAVKSGQVTQTSDQQRKEMKRLDLSTIRHDQVHFDTLIRPALWDAASWTGVAYAHTSVNDLPILAMVFAQKTSAERLWKQLINDIDEAGDNPTLKITIVTGVNAQNRHEYSVLITDEIDWNTVKPGEVHQMLARIHRMTPSQSENIEWFLKAFQTYNGFNLGIAALLGSQYKLINAPHIRIRSLNVKQAYDIGPDDLERLVLKPNDVVFIPEGITNPPVFRTLAKLREHEDRHKPRSDNGKQKPS